MKKYVAFNGSMTSGITTKDKAVEWAAQMLGTNTKIDKFHIAEVVEIVQRTTPTVETKQFFCQLDEPALKPEFKVA